MTAVAGTQTIGAETGTNGHVCNTATDQDAVSESRSSGSKRATAMNSDRPHNRRAHYVTNSMKTFVDAESMKEKVRQSLSKPPYNVTNYYKDSGIAQWVARSGRFELAALGVIVLNAGYLWLDTDLNPAAVMTDSPPFFIVAENLFCSFFTFELCVRFGAFKSKRDCMRDAWFVFDASMVAMMVIETWLLPVGLLLGGFHSGGQNGGILRVARLLRLSRMARMARIMRAMPEMMIMLRGMKAAARSVIVTLALLAIFIYVFAIMFVQLGSLSPEGEVVDREGRSYFPTVGTAMAKLLIHGTLLDDFGVVVSDIGRGPFYMLVLFALFVLIASMTLMNMLIGVLCEVVCAVASVEKEEMLVSYVREKLVKICSIVDVDTTGKISKSDFMDILEHKECVHLLREVGIDAVALVEFADYIFDSPDDSEDDMGFPKFMEVMLQFRGCNQATVKDIVDLRKYIHMDLKLFIHDALQEHLENTIFYLDACNGMTRAPSKQGLAAQELPRPSVDSTQSKGSARDQRGSGRARRSLRRCRESIRQPREQRAGSRSRESVWAAASEVAAHHRTQREDAAHHRVLPEELSKAAAPEDVTRLRAPLEGLSKDELISRLVRAQMADAKIVAGPRLSFQGDAGCGAKAAHPPPGRPLAGPGWKFAEDPVPSMNSNLLPTPQTDVSNGHDLSQKAAPRTTGASPRRGTQPACVAAAQRARSSVVVSATI